jgi:hypothetical protein
MPNLAQAMLTHVLPVYISTTRRGYQDSLERDKPTIISILTAFQIYRLFEGNLYNGQLEYNG